MSDSFAATRTDDPTFIEAQFDPFKRTMAGVARHGNVPFIVPYMSHIKDNLWMGGSDSSLVLPDYIEHLVSLYVWGGYRINHKLKSHLEVKMHDNNEGPNRTELVKLARHINKCRKDGPTLVHCQAGLNRSGLATALALMLGDKMSARDAVLLLREKRSPAVLCNTTFYTWLKEFKA